MNKTSQTLVFLIFVLPLRLWAQESSFYVNLQDYPLYLKAGFDGAQDLRPSNEKDDSWHEFTRIGMKQKGWTISENDDSWQEFTSWSNVIISKLKLPDRDGQPKRAFLSPFGRHEQEWTIVIPFIMEDQPPLFPGLYMAAIGDNWEIYLNETLVRSEMHLNDKGSIEQHHSERDVFFPIDRALFRTGENLLTFRIVGDPTDQTIGFQYSSPYYLADYEYISLKNSETLEMLLIGLFILTGVYHFLIFAINRQSRYNCFCGAFSLFMGLYFLFRTHGIYYLIPDTWIVVKLEFFFIFLAIPVMGAYTEMLCLGCVQQITKIYSSLFAFLAVSQLFFVHSYGSDALIVWQLLGIAALLWIFVHNLLLPFVREIKAGRKLCDALWNSYPGNLLIGISFFIFSAVADIANALFLHYPKQVSHFALCVFVLATAVMLTRLYGKLNRELAEKSALLENAENTENADPPEAAREAVFIAHGLTEREKEVARLIVEGLSNTEIAGRLFISESAIGFHITNIYRKFAIEGKNNGRAAFLQEIFNGGGGRLCEYRKHIITVE
ncbi:hypothetical protein FACS1894200_00930 [Spirochaetia bacterium]|nr:hypothetical protein FACS1894200_00930 [Spirochaetia bacterium]